MSVNKQRIIWADDELEFLQPHKLFLEKRGFEVETVNSGEDAIESIKNSYYDLLLIDEAHRIAKTSNFQYTRKEDKTDIPQVEQLIRCSKTSVFFIDDKQNVRS